MPPRPGKPAEVAVCAVDLADVPLAPALAVLSGPELSRARRITSSDYLAQHVKGRALLRWWLAQITGQAPKSFQIVENDQRAPRLLINPWGIHFSLSHSHDWVLLALARSPVGIDIERMEPKIDLEAIAGQCFHPREQRHLDRLDRVAHCETFFDLWTRKEAFLKGIGTGLGTDPASFSVLAPAGAVATDCSGPSRPTWYTRSIDAPAGYKAALASHAPDDCVTYCQPEAFLAEAHAEGAGRALCVPGARAVPATVAEESAA